VAHMQAIDQQTGGTTRMERLAGSYGSSHLLGAALRPADLSSGRYFIVKTRTLNGNYHVLQLAAGQLTDANAVGSESFSPKTVTPMVPVALAVVLMTSVLLVPAVSKPGFKLQVVCYALNLQAMPKLRCGSLGQLANAAFMFVVNNEAAIAFANSMSGGKTVCGQ
jgi:hypothetical protein